VDKQTAKQILSRMEACIDLLSEVVEIAHANCGESEEKIVRRGVGQVLSEIQDRLTDPLYREYPDLLPQDVDYSPMPGQTLPEMASKVGPK
jgi:hypothetical protein